MMFNLSIRDIKSVPPKVDDYTEYWSEPPPKLSPRCLWWVEKIRKGFNPNARITQMDYDNASEFYGVYIWEYLNVIFPLTHLKGLVAYRLQGAPPRA